MLFDLRGRGRRRTVQAIYLGLAVLIGGGLIFFGVGGAGVGLLNSSDNSGSSGGGDNVLTKKLQQAEKRARAHPSDPQAWAELTRQRYQNADYDETQNRFTAQGLKELHQAERAWDHYVALKPAKPDPALARLMANVFAPDVLDRPAKEVTALEIVVQDQPTAAAYSQLAVASYRAGNLRKGDLAAQQAVRRTAKGDRANLRASLDDEKKSALKKLTGAGGSGGSG
jgi:hypothetical protein